MVTAISGAALAAACDVKGGQHNQATVGPALNVIASNIEGTAATIPSDGYIQLAFDRYLLPATITRQSYALLDADHHPIGPLPLRTIYDPVARTVTIVGPDGVGTPWLTPDLTYRLVLLVPTDDTNVGGFRAIDRATLAADRELLFRAGPPSGQRRIVGQPDIDFCADVNPILQRKCGNCHTSGSAFAGLVLTGNGIPYTAVDRVAQGANTGAHAGVPEEGNNVFGVNMAIIKPGDPGSSWLIYKIELAPPPTVDAGVQLPLVCSPPKDQPLVGPPNASSVVPGVAFRQPSDAERQVLSDDVLGREMPYRGINDCYANLALTFEERETVRIWIAAGAKTRDCGACSEPPSTAGCQ